MFGPPDDVPGECNARLYIGDDFGDNTTTMRCSMTPGHDGKHLETFRDGDCRIEWSGCDRARERVQNQECLCDTLADLMAIHPDFDRFTWDGTEVTAYGGAYNPWVSTAFTPESDSRQHMEMMGFLCDLEPPFDTTGEDFPKPSFDLSPKKMQY